jgi:formate-nitrite transporter family protein
MSSLWEQRAARNEALFREVNENIALLEERHSTTATEPEFVCECADADCTERFAVDPATFRRVREQPRFFLVRPGHEDPQLERIVERHRDYLIVEKTGEAGQVAEQTNS